MAYPMDAQSLKSRKAEAIGPGARLLNIDHNAKTVKGRKLGFLTGVLYLAPADLSGFEVCPMRSAGCTAACLNTAGRGAFDSVQRSRINRTRFYFEDRPAFLALLVKEIAALVRKAEKQGLTPAVRLNGTSDIPWERVRVSKWESDAALVAEAIGAAHWSDVSGETLFDLFPGVQFYDYTKITKRAAAWAEGKMPANYHLTLSATEENHGAVEHVLGLGGNVSMVFGVPKAGDLPTTWGGVDVINGDETDVRFYDPDNVIVGLVAKGEAKGDKSGFVRHI